MDFDELFEDTPLIGVVICWVISVLIVLVLRKRWIGTSLEMGVLQVIIFSVILIVPSYFIVRHIANKD